MVSDRAIISIDEDPALHGIEVTIELRPRLLRFHIERPFRHPSEPQMASNLADRAAADVRERIYPVVLDAVKGLKLPQFVPTYINTTAAEKMAGTISDPEVIKSILGIAQDWDSKSPGQKWAAAMEAAKNPLSASPKPKPGPPICCPVCSFSDPTLAVVTTHLINDHAVPLDVANRWSKSKA